MFQRSFLAPAKATLKGPVFKDCNSARKGAKSDLTPIKKPAE